VAQRIAPEARIVYVDNDPLVLAHANALLTSTSSGATSYINADVRDPDAILDRAAGTLDFSRPVGLILMGVLAHVADYEEARAIVRSLLAALPPGSFLAVRDGADTDPDYREAIRGYNASGAVPYHLRSPEQIASFLDGLELVEPGVVPCPAWRPEVSLLGAADDVALLGGVGRKA
jgi:O-methyltransferase involved in polyketide biosynthesis